MMRAKRITVGLLIILAAGLSIVQAQTKRTIRDGLVPWLRNAPSVGPLETGPYYTRVLLASGLPAYAYGVGVPAKGRPVFITTVLNGLYSYKSGTLTFVTSTGTDLGTCRASQYGFYVGDGSGNVFRLDPATGDLNIVGAVPNTYGIGGLAVDPANGDLYISEYDTGYGCTIWRLKRGSSTPKGLVVLGGPTAGLTVVGNTLYMIANDHDILRMPKLGGTVKTFLTGFSSLADIVADAGGNLYFTDASATRLYGLKKGTTHPGLIGWNLSYPSGVGVDGNGNVYTICPGNHTLVMFRRSF